MKLIHGFGYYIYISRFVHSFSWTLKFHVGFSYPLIEPNFSMKQYSLIRKYWQCEYNMKLIFQKKSSFNNHRWNLCYKRWFMFFFHIIFTLYVKGTVLNKITLVSNTSKVYFQTGSESLFSQPTDRHRQLIGCENEWLCCGAGIAFIY